MTYLLAAGIGILAALLLFAAYLAGYRRGRRHLHADVTALRQLTADQHASLMAIPATAVEHRQQVAADQQRRYAATIARIDEFVFSLRTVRHG
ncbi:hypothetical protein AB0875_12725 [Micromonospora gifhornensis]|uniref:hypothetical protein n=1 Tax=Micromonospora gifhornensis TaxID=84594 RepID=UPI0034539B31